MFFDSLAEAQHAGALVVLEDNDLGQEYLTCPARLVGCSLEALLQLLDDLRGYTFSDAGLQRVRFTKLSYGTGEVGTCGNLQELWLHDDFVELGLKPEVADVVAGRRARIRQAKEEDRF